MQFIGRGLLFRGFISSAGIGLALLIAMGSGPPAQATCVTAVTTVTCSGATTNQNPPNGFGTGNEDGMTINVLTGATVTGNGVKATGSRSATTTP